uniref:Uncharacterized protein n=1 Tax=Ditylum brightwellii TaxID=49249 RepID=A0A6U4ALZ4_9STRA|mmetsp:Transcript_23362/g.34854  ORF Transcript_23362/g.34854 Transcript_23362/m.34854 type:complete len:207 (+) Transcript_23362:544-1164(+)|eukprot:15346240-Ditylum_brightwellii.AAC.1
MDYLYRTDSFESLPLAEACAPVSPMSPRCEPFYKGHTSWKDIQEEMRSSGITTNAAAIEYMKKRLSNQSETCPRGNETDNSSKGFLTRFQLALFKEDSGNMSTEYPDKAEFLTWYQKLSYVKGLLNPDHKQSEINQEREACNDSSTSIEKFQARVHASLRLDDSVPSFSPPVVLKTNTQQMRNPIEMQNIKPKKPRQSKPYVARSA